MLMLYTTLPAESKLRIENKGVQRCYVEVVAWPDQAE